MTASVQPGQGDAARQHIVGKALELFSTQGYERTGMKDVGRAAGLGEDGVEAYFPSKQALTEAVLASVLTMVRGAVFSTAYDDALPARERLQKMAATIRAIMGQFGICPMAQLAIELHPADIVAKKHVADYFVELTKAIEHVLRAELPEAEAVKRAEQAVSALYGAAMVSWAKGDTALLEEAFTNIAATLDR